MMSFQMKNINMKSHSYLLILLIVSCIVQSNAGILDWFRSKPNWISKIDKYPLIEAFHPKGLRVSISDVEGMQTFGFHGNLNECFKRQAQGGFYADTFEPTNGRWYYINETIELKVGDALHYWIYVKLNGEEYSFSKEIRVIRNLAPLPSNLYTGPDSFNPRLSTPEVSALPTTIITTNDATTCKCPDVGLATDIDNRIGIAGNEVDVLNEGEINSVNPELLSCHFQVDSLTEVVLDLLKDSKMHSKLVLVGKEIENTVSALEEIKKFLTNYLELYDLGKKVTVAEYRKCGLFFEMSSIVDKKRILLRAATDMKNSRQRFIEPEEAEC